MGVMCDAPLSAEEGQPSLEVSNIRLTRILKIEKQTRVDSERTENSLEQGDRLLTEDGKPVRPLLLPSSRSHALLIIILTPIAVSRKPT